MKAIRRPFVCRHTATVFHFFSRILKLEWQEVYWRLLKNCFLETYPFMCVLRTILHLIAIFWKNFNVEEIGCLLVRPMFYVFVFLFIMESHLCVLILIFDKDLKIIKQLWNIFSEYLPPLWCPATQGIASVASQITSVLNSDFCQNVFGSSACSCSVKTPWRQRAAESSGWCVCSPSLKEPIPGTLTLPAVQVLRTVSYFVQLSNS